MITDRSPDSTDPTRPAHIVRLVGPHGRTPGQTRRLYRDLVICAARRQGCSIRLIAAATGLAPARVRAIVLEAEGRIGPGEYRPPRDCPRS